MLAAHQPNYLPWLGSFYKLGQADVWVIGDDVQYTKHGLINRNRIRTATSWQWLTVPVLTRGRGLQHICDVQMDTTQTWQRKHWQALQWNYHKAAHFADHEPFLALFYQRQWRNLVELNVALCEYLLQQFGYLLSEIAGQKWGQVDARKKLPFPGERMHTFETFFLKEETSS